MKEETYKKKERKNIDCISVRSVKYRRANHFFWDITRRHFVRTTVLNRDCFPVKEKLIKAAGCQWISSLINEEL